jgi:hypothetical protein
VNMYIDMNVDRKAKVYNILGIYLYIYS